MALTTAQRVRQTTVQDGGVVDTTRQVENPLAERDHKKNVAARVVWFIAGILLSLLAIRFALALLGANPASGFVNFIYDVTYPFVAPFFGVFSYNFTAGQTRFETYTLLAMAIYALVAYGIARALTLTRRGDTV